MDSLVSSETGLVSGGVCVNSEVGSMCSEAEAVSNEAAGFYLFIDFLLVTAFLESV